MFNIQLNRGCVQIDSGKYEHITDTHLSKKYNDVLYDCIMRCNVTGLILESAPHFDNLKTYYAAIDNFFMSSYILFNNIHVKFKGNQTNLSDALTQMRKKVKYEMDQMKLDPTKRTQEYFDKVAEDCNKIRMWIMWGLQKRQMLVRTSDPEPRGQDSIDYWDTKAIFKKGGIKAKGEKLV